MRTLHRAMSSDEDALAEHYANECARTLLAYHQAEQDNLKQHAIDACWSYHSCAVDLFERTFPKLDDWEKFAEPNLMRAVEEARP